VARSHGAGGNARGNGVGSILLIRLRAVGFFSRDCEGGARLIASSLPQRLPALLGRCLAVVGETTTLA